MMDTTDDGITQAITDYKKQAALLLDKNAILKTRTETQEVLIQEQARMIAWLDKKVRELEAQLEKLTA